MIQVEKEIYNLKINNRHFMSLLSDQNIGKLQKLKEQHLKVKRLKEEKEEKEKKEKKEN